MLGNDDNDYFNTFEIINNDSSIKQNKNRDSYNSIFNYQELEENKLNFNNNKDKKKNQTGIWAYIKNQIINK